MLVAKEGPTTKTEPLRKQRSKPQVSEVFCSVSIDLYAKTVNPEYSIFVLVAKIFQRQVQILSDC
jgi:hypothetical protein